MSVKHDNGMIITGTVTNEGVECPAVRTADGQLYTIATFDREKLRPAFESTFGPVRVF